MKTWLRSGIIGGIAGVCLHILLNFGPLLLGYSNFFNPQTSTSLLVLSDLSLTYNLSRFVLYFVAGSILGLLLGFIVQTIRSR